MTAPKIEVEYHITTGNGDEPVVPTTLPPALLRYFEQRRRALITELRQLEKVLGVEQSVPERQRPH